MGWQTLQKGFYQNSIGLTFKIMLVEEFQILMWSRD
jgi:hypothetical protein